MESFAAVSSGLIKRATFRVLTSIAVQPRPALQARLDTVLVTRVVAKEIVSRPAELVAAEAKVMLVAPHAHLEVELSHGAVVLQLLPLGTGGDHAGVGGLLNQRPANT